MYNTVTTWRIWGNSEKEPGKNLIIETFKNRVALLKFNLDDKQKKIIKYKINSKYFVKVFTLKRKRYNKKGLQTILEEDGFDIIFETYFS